MARVWLAKDADFLSDPAIVELGEQHGPGGPLVIDALLGLCKLAREGGRVTVGYTALARRAFLPGHEECRAILRDAAEFGVLEVQDVDSVRCEVSFPAWGKWQDAFKKAQQRAKGQQRDKGGTGGGQQGDASVRATIDREQKTTTTEEVANATSVEPGLDRSTIPDLFAYWQQQCDHPQARLTRDRRQKIQARLKEGYTPEQIRVAIDGAAKAAFVNDQGKRFDDLELICRTGSKLESFIDRAVEHGAGSDDDAFLSRLQIRRQTMRGAA